jgi:hypothetical protein
VNPPPAGIPTDFICLYATNTQKDFYKAKEMGWAPMMVKHGENDPSDIRQFVGKFKTYPEVYIPSLREFDKIFITDSDVVKLDSGYGDFIQLCLMYDEKELYATSGYYSGGRNNIQAELIASINQKRWLYDSLNMVEATSRYIYELKKWDIPVVSAKFIAWNMKKKGPIAMKYLAESMRHLQGNIILSYLAEKYPESVMIYTGFKNDVIQSRHKAER